MANNTIAGRQVQVGIGIETTPGTPVSAAAFIEWESLSLLSMADKTLLQSARGIRNKTSDSIVINKYGKGTIEFVPTVRNLPFFLELFMGSRTTADHSGETTVYDHTMAIQNANASMKTATLTIMQGALQTERYANVVVDTFDLTVDKDFAKVKIGLLGNFPDTSSISPSYSQQTLFSRNQLLAFFGTSLSNAIGSPASATLTSDATKPSDGDVVVIGTITYTYKTTLTGAPYEVLIGAAAADSLDNIKSAINGSSGAGTTYGTGTVAHPLVIATANADTTQVIKAIVNGTLANAIVTTTTSTYLSWDGATMDAGTPGVGAGPTPLVSFSLAGKNNVAFADAFLSGANTPINGGWIAGDLEITGTYVIQFSNTTDLARYQNNTKQALVVELTGAQVGVVPSFEQIILKYGKLILTKAPVEYNINGVNYLKQEFTVQYDATDLEFGAVITNTDDGTDY